MKTKAAVLWERNTPWSIEEIELDDPKDGEVLVRLVASGMCHSDEHAVTGDLPVSLPMVCGHEGAGVVEAVGPGVSRVKPGDHVVFAFIPACGECPSCSTGHQNLCDNGAGALGGLKMDNTSRHHAQGQDLYTLVGLGTFAHHTVVHEWSCVPIDKQIPLDRACLVGCGVTTGWGSAVYAAEVKPGDDVAIIGIGGIGAAALMGAKLAGAERIFAIDPVEFKRDEAKRLGATHVAASVEEAFGLIQQETWGRMCNKVIACVGVGSGAEVAATMALVAKRGRLVVTNIHPMLETEVTLSMADLTLMEKQIVGSLFGSANPLFDIPRLLRLYSSGLLDLDALVTRTYSLDDVNQGFDDMRSGVNLRGVLTLG
ncbi:MAG TPA: NDMA-dependent alcohol dehydrogenase [Iamia sp.]|nr:NDMA-dependent alcohol dehydrogenase [Iamia sp.]